ncbi:MAG: helix-turn-helix transcriptional regulator [Chthoniobacter sp.]
MAHLHHQLSAGTFPNCRKLADALEVSSKTIQRDIDFMRDRLHYPIQWDQAHLGFYYTEPVGKLPGMEVSEGEVVALFVAQKALEQYRGTSFEKSLRTAFQKISAGLDGQIRFQWSDIETAISFRGLGATVADLELFETVSRAVLDQHELTFDYKKLGGSRHEARRIQPYHLGCVENQWYLFGHDLARRQLRTFALPRTRRARHTGVRFQRPADFSIAQHLSDSFGVFRSQSGSGGSGNPSRSGKPSNPGTRHRIRLRFDPFAARLVSERQWHASQKMKRFPDGSLELTLTLGSLEEIERWILSWGEHATVLAPPALLTRLRVIATTLARRYAPAVPLQ